MQNNIPKIIYYCWFGEEKPQKAVDCIQNWKEKLPDYEIVEINEHNKELFDVEKECQNNLWFRTVWENKLWAFASDYARLKVLYERGGVYFDSDITVEKDITELLEKNKLIFGWEDTQDLNVSVGVVITKPNCFLLKEMLDFYNYEIWHSKLYTIPHIVTYTLKKHYALNTSTQITENDDIMILPHEYFYPVLFDDKDKDAKDYITPNTYTIHWWNASWIKPNIMYFMKHKNRINLELLLKKCFIIELIIDNPFIRIERHFTTYDIRIDSSYIFRFKYRICEKHKYLTLFILGIQIPIWRIY